MLDDFEAETYALACKSPSTRLYVRSAAATGYPNASCWYPMYERLSVRQESFAPQPSLRELADDGFFYNTGKLGCYQCGYITTKTAPQTPASIQQHQRFAPECVMAMRARVRLDDLGSKCQ